MPIYEYQCLECGRIFEKFQIVRQSVGLPPCPECQRTETRQLLSRFSSPSSDGTNLGCTPSSLS
jgi:putative FmdB family regulatory protein